MIDGTNERQENYRAFIHSSTSTTSAIVLMKLGEPWFEDGNIILYAKTSRQLEQNGGDSSRVEETIGFRVHRGFLARQSEMFRPMFELPQPEQDAQEMADVWIQRGVDEQLVRGCQFVQMHDDANELGKLLKVLYDGL